MKQRRKISSKLRTARVERGLTQLELGQKLNLSESTVCRIEAGQPIDTDRLAHFAQALDIDQAFFYRDDIDINQIFRVD